VCDVKVSNKMYVYCIDTIEVRSDRFGIEYQRRAMNCVYWNLINKHKFLDQAFNILSKFSKQLLITCN